MELVPLLAVFGFFRKRVKKQGALKPGVEKDIQTYLNIPAFFLIW